MTHEMVIRILLLAKAGRKVEALYLLHKLGGPQDQAAAQKAAAILRSGQRLDPQVPIYNFPVARRVREILTA